MKMSFELTTNLKIPEVKAATEKAARLALRDTVVAIDGEAVQNSPYLTGNNRRSIASEVGPGGEVAKDDMQGAVYSTSGYGGYLETGTVKMGARPYFKPALDKEFTAEKVAERIKRHLK